MTTANNERAVPMTSPLGILESVLLATSADDDSASSAEKDGNEFKTAPLSPKLPSRSEERRVMRMLRNVVPLPSASKALAIAVQQSLAGLRVQYRKQAAQNYSTYSENINRLINTLLFEILLLGGPAAHANNKTFAAICAMCIKQEYRESVETRRSTWRYIEDNIDELIRGAEETSVAIQNDDNRSSSSSSVSLRTSADINDYDSYVSAYAEQFSADIYESCVFKMHQVRQLIRERNAQQQLAEQTEKHLCLNMFEKFQVNCRLAHACSAVNPATGITIPADAEQNSCTICTNKFDESRAAVLMTCCKLKNALCAPCLVRAAFAGSAMGCNSFFNCAFCKAAISIYDHLDAPPPPPTPLFTIPPTLAARPSESFAQSIGDSVKQNSSRRRMTLQQQHQPTISTVLAVSSPRSRRRPVNKRKKLN